MTERLRECRGEWVGEQPGEQPRERPSVSVRTATRHRFLLTPTQDARIVSAYETKFHNP
jgi:hypothetical protein